MNGYWDALARAALDLPSDADPRPRSRFEGEQGIAGERLDAIEEAVDGVVETSSGEVDSRSAVPAEPMAQARPAATTATTRLHNQPLDATPTVSLEPSPTEPTPAAAARPEVAPRNTDPTTPKQPIAIERIERVEVQRKETTHTIREVPALPALESRGEEPWRGTGEPGSAGHAEAEAQPTLVAAAPRERVVETHVVSRAEPVAQAPVERGRDEQDVTADELAPLVIEIDRVDIRIEHDQPLPVAARAARQVGGGDVHSLNDYLARRSEAPA
jgi:hypothetical protein